MRAVFWGMLTILILLLFAAVLVHIICAPVIVAAGRFFIGLNADMSAQGAFPEWAVFCAVISLYGFVILCCGMPLLALGLVTKQTYLVARHKIENGHRFRDYPSLRGLYRVTFRTLVARVLVVAVIVTLAYSVSLVIALGSPLSVWWVPLTFTGVLAFSVRRFPPWSGFVTTYRQNLYLTQRDSAGSSEG